MEQNLPTTTLRGAGVVLNPCMGGHRIVTCNGTADLTTEGVHELDQVHGGVREASSGFDEENGQVLGVIHEVAEDGAVPGPFVRLAEREDPG